MKLEWRVRFSPTLNSSPLAAVGSGLLRDSARSTMLSNMGISESGRRDVEYRSAIFPALRPQHMRASSRAGLVTSMYPIHTRMVASKAAMLMKLLSVWLMTFVVDHSGDQRELNAGKGAEA